MIDISNVNFQYKGSAEAGLHDVSLQIKDGETVLLCGESGCGKTTVTRLINGLIPHYYNGELTGSITVNGIDIAKTELYELASVVGTVFQNPRSQFFAVDTDGEITFGTENIGLPPDEIIRRKNEVTEKMQLGPLLGKSLFALSGGEKQKIACASVSALLPDIMILDEPSSNLDWQAIDELKNVICKWKEQGKTIVISEHRLWYLKDLVDRVLYLQNGRIANEWSREEFRAFSADMLENYGLRPVTIEEKYIREFGSDMFVPEKKSELPVHERTVTFRDLYFSYTTPKYLLRKKKLSAENADSCTLAISELCIPQGSVIGLTGKNGAGKSTLLRCICGLEKSCPVKLTINGETVSGRQLLKKCYMVMQDVNHQLFTDSVESEVMLSMQNEDRNRADSLIAELGLSGSEDTHPMALSGGQKQRVAICSALAADAEILLFDEPTSGLDHKHMKTVGSLLRSLAESGKTVIVSTHDPELIALCCQYLLRLENGRIKYIREV